ncbi:MAG: hypothetical protein CBE00_05585 [Planctomycetaceae bacterium TMED240]|nr:hypothetical protein [Rhodopirellula sp.]OUX07218.1 MAG: hypothetical protein CBE00_05585 [Planctomycetaceae bacterium TMED240]
MTPDQSEVPASTARLPAVQLFTKRRPDELLLPKSAQRTLPAPIGLQAFTDSPTTSPYRVRCSGKDFRISSRLETVVSTA